MEEAKMELMRTAKCPDNQGVPVLILANKQDLPDACSPNELEKLLGLHELQNPLSNFSTATSMSTSNIAAFNANNQTHISREPNVINQLRSPIAPPVGKFTSNSNSKVKLSNMPDDELDSNIPSNAPITPNALSENSSQFTLCSSSSSGSVQLKGWFIQPACAITGEGLQEGLDALYDMILKRRKLSKVNKKNKR
ncbi:CG2219 [Drosophila busckii]|uniref:CG2219 n=2 Tax=Drosophila busckii TaxID=30019 RepID=A0A0M5J5P0_DROBS|nr:CG2219 [Drosophila busckii]